jgi:tetratricopeptide (TPR) repeat protein
MDKLKQAILTIIILVSIVSMMMALNLEDVLFIESLYKDGVYDMALREIGKIESQLENDRYSNQIWLIKADILIKRGNYSEAKKILLKLNSQTLTPVLTAEVTLSLATIEKMLNNPAGAFDLVNIFIRRHPDNPRINDANQLLADLYFDTGQFNEAERIYLELHEKNKSAATFVNLIRVAAQKKEFNNAEAQLANLRRDYPRAHLEHQQGLFILLSALEVVGNSRRIIELCPDNFDHQTSFSEPNILKKVSAHINLKQFTEASALLANIKNDPRQVNYYNALIHIGKGEENLALPIFRVLANSDADEQIRTMSFFNAVQITAKSNPTQAHSELMEFLIANPDQPWEGDILYQLGFIEFTNRNFDKAYEHITNSLNFRLNPVNRQMALYLKGEIEFLRDDFEAAYITFSENIYELPEQFSDEALFKLGASAFHLRRTVDAQNYLNQLVTRYPNSQKVGIGYYYLGELELFSNPLSARTNYLRALSSGQFDAGVLNLRIAYTDFLREEYPAALERLNSVPETADYIYDKHLLRGNILFAQRSFVNALESYRIALQNAQDMESAEYIMSRQAWTHYNMQQYDAATAIYLRLSEQGSNSPGRFLLSAAGSAFNAENFPQAAELYSNYIRTYPNSPDLHRALVGLANSHFNLGNHTMSIDIWKQMIHENQTQAILEAALRGLRISYERLNQIPNFTEFLNLTIFGSNNRAYVTFLYEYKAHFEYEQKNYTASVATINRLINQYPEKKDDVRLMILLANNYTFLNRFEEADQIYLELIEKTGNDPLVYHEWGNLKWAQGDYTAALIRYKRAADNSRVEQYWLVLMGKLVIRRDADFIRYFDQFIQFASPHHRTLAQIHMIDWHIANRNFTGAETLVSEVITSNQPLLRATATLKRGEINFAQRNFEEALSSFYRVRYVFSEFSDIRWHAEFFIVRTLHATGERERARTHFSAIRENLTDEQIKQLNALF